MKVTFTKLGVYFLDHHFFDHDENLQSMKQFFIPTAAKENGLLELYKCIQPQMSSLLSHDDCMFLTEFCFGKERLNAIPVNEYEVTLDPQNVTIIFE